MSKARLVVSLVAAALFPSGCNWGSYENQGNGNNIFVIHQSVGDQLIWNCTADFGVSGRAKCALDLIWATCQQNDAGDDGWPYCYDATRYSHLSDMEKAIEDVTGPGSDCLAFAEGNFESAPLKQTAPVLVDQPFDPATGAPVAPRTQFVTYETIWEGVKSGTFGCP